jgi:formylmethanofuran dehydrogenase subunit B
MNQVFTDIACTVCGCACDDLIVSVDGDRVTRAERACQLAQPWFAELSRPLTRPLATVDGKPSSTNDAIERAVAIFRASRAPLIFGLSRSSTEGQRAAIALAEQIGGTIDTPASCHPAATLAFQAVGQSTCSLGEVRNRADLVIFWRANPAVSHPRHLERYSMDAAGMFTPNGRADREVVVIDASPTETSALADQFIPIAADADVETCKVLHEHISNAEKSDADAGSVASELQLVAQKMRSCQYGAVFVGTGQGGCDRASIEVLIQLVAELNKFTRFTLHFLPDSGGLTGAENVLCWQTGFPFAVSFANGYPQYDPVELSANKLLESGKVDTCVIVGGELTRKLSPDAQEALGRVPLIALDSPISATTPNAAVQFTTAIYGVHAVGTAYRMDGVPIPLRQLLPSPYPTDEEVLNSIASRLR